MVTLSCLVHPLFFDIYNSFLCQGNFEERHYFALAIVNGFLEFRFSMGAQPVVIRFVFYLMGCFLNIIVVGRLKPFSLCLQVKGSSEHKKSSESYGKTHHLK